MTARLGTDNRAAVRAMASELVARAPQEIRERLQPHIATFCDQLVWGMENATLPGPNGGIVNNPGHRTAMDLYARIMGAVAPDTLIVNLWQRIGVDDEETARRLIERARETEGMDEETAFRLSESYVQDYRRRHGMPELIEAPRIAQDGRSRADTIQDSREV